MPPDETVEHIIVEEAPGEHQAEAPGATETVVAAETAVALATATAAAAELDAAERLRRLEMESEEWRLTQGTGLRELQSSLQTLREDELHRHEQERNALAENFRLLSERQEALEAQYLSLTPPASEAVEEVEEANPTLGTEAEIVAGPVEVSSGVSLEAENENSPKGEPGKSAHPVRRRRWI